MQTQALKTNKNTHMPCLDGCEFHPVCGGEHAEDTSGSDLELRFRGLGFSCLGLRGTSDYAQFFGLSGLGLGGYGSFRK